MSHRDNNIIENNPNEVQDLFIIEKSHLKLNNEEVYLNNL